MSVESFEKLEVYQRAHRVAVDVCRLISQSKNFGLRDQMIRSALSIPSNIAEGAERSGKAEFKQFLGYAKGSAGELRCQVSIARELREMNDTKALRIHDELFEISRMLHGLIKSLSHSPS